MFIKAHGGIFFLAGLLAIVVRAADVPSGGIERDMQLLFKKYHAISADVCRASMSMVTDPAIPAKELRSDHDCACLLAGYRNVVMLTEVNRPSIAKDVAHALEHAVFLHQIKIIDIFGGYRIICKADEASERNALLLAKYLMLDKFVDAQSVVSYAYASNNWLIGSLLGYAKEDIDFFYQRKTFLAVLKKDYPHELEMLNFVQYNPYKAWTPSLQKAFNTGALAEYSAQELARDRVKGEQFITPQCMFFPTLESLRMSVEKSSILFNQLLKEYPALEE